MFRRSISTLKRNDKFHVTALKERIAKIMFRKSPSNSEKQDDQVPIIVNESLEHDIQASDQHVAEGKFLFI